MLELGFILGLAVGICFWLWQQVQLNRYLGQVLRPFTSDSEKVALPLIPRLRHEIASVQQQRQYLQSQLQIYQDLLELAPVGYLQVDEENQLLWCNQQAREILNLERWQPGQIRLLLELVRSYELDKLIEKTRNRAALQVKEWVFHPPCENPAAMLEIKSLALRATSLPLSEGKVAVFLENRQPLLDMSQARDHAFSDLAHELRTPLTSIRLVVETLQARLEPPLNRWADRLMQEVDRLINLVQSWLELTQLETNPSIQLQRQPVEVRTLIASVWESLEPLAQRNQIQISYSGAEKLWINADKTRIYQVFLNLLDNSIKYSPASGIIRVQANLTKQEKNQGDNDSPVLEINIIDSGIGFAEEDLPHVFRRFYRGDKARSRSRSVSAGLGDSFGVSRSFQEKTTQTSINGSGLGLAIVRQIVLAHGGTIKAMNHPETGGAWLQLQLPQVMANTQT